MARRAVATLDEAREEVLDYVWTCEAYSERDPEPDLDAARSLPEQGGTVGPLPDGTVIEVERIGWPDLCARVQPRIADPNPSEAQIIDAYNAND